MGAGLHQENSVIHQASNADYKKYNYNRVYAAIEKDVEINGTTVTMTKGLILPIAVIPNGVKAASGGNLDNIYLLGNRSPENKSLG